MNDCMKQVSRMNAFGNIQHLFFFNIKRIIIIIQQRKFIYLFIIIKNIKICRRNITKVEYVILDKIR